MVLLERFEEERIVLVVVLYTTVVQIVELTDLNSCDFLGISDFQYDDLTYSVNQSF